MANTYGRKSGGANWIVVAVIAFVVLSLAGGAFNFLQRATPEGKAAQLTENYDSQFMNDPRFGGVFTKFKTEFPADYEHMKSQVIAAVRAGASDEQVSDIFGTYMRHFMLTHNADLAAAPSVNLKDIRAVQLQAILALQKTSDEQCSGFFTTGGMDVEHSDPAAIDAMASLTSVTMDAIVAGRDTPAVHAKLTTADDVAFVRSLRSHGMTQDQLAIFTDSKKLAAATAHDRCAIGVITMQTLADEPDGLADKLTVEIIRSAARPA